MVKLSVVFASLSTLNHSAQPYDKAQLLDHELALDYEHGLMLLLNASDVEMAVQGLFLFDKSAAFNFDESLIKKLKQLELFDVPCYAALSKDSHEEEGQALVTLCEHLPFIKVIAYEDFIKLESNSEQVIWV